MDLCEILYGVNSFKMSFMGYQFTKREMKMMGYKPSSFLFVYGLFQQAKKDVAILTEQPWIYYTAVLLTRSDHRRYWAYGKGVIPRVKTTPSREL